MELIEEVLKDLFNDFKSVDFINVDKIKDNVYPYILHFRVREGSINVNPIILYGFRSFEELIRSEKEYCRLVITPGIYYLQLPTDLPKIEKILGLIKNSKIDHDILKSELSSSILGNSRVEAKIAHDMGNYLGPEKLIYGAYIAGVISWKKFQELLTEVRDSQKKAFGENHGYFLYQLQQLKYNYQSTNSSKGFSPFEGKILYIDDHAHLGWASAVATALWGEYTKDQKNTAISSLEWYKATSCKGEMAVIRKIDVKNNEDKFVEEAIDVVKEKENIKHFDLVLLDLRLRWKEDEDIGEENLDDLSGVKVLKEIRNTNAAIPIVVLTASRKAKNMERVLSLGADAYFMKEIPRTEETKEYILGYYNKFRKCIKEGLSKSYLGHAWYLLESLEGKNPKDFVKKELDYSNLDEKYKLNWENEVITPFKKAIGFLKRKQTECEDENFSLNTINEAIINLYLPNDVIDKKNREYNEENNKEYNKGEKKDRIYLYEEPYWGPEYLLLGLRSLVAHGTGEMLDEDDAKIALYLGFRLFLSPDNLKELSKKIFKIEPLRLNQLKNNFFIKVNKKILQTLSIYKPQQIFEKGNYKIRLLNKKEIQVQYPKSSYWATYKLDEFPSILNYPLSDSPVFKALRDNKINHYLQFLSRLSSFIKRLQKQNQNLNINDLWLFAMIVKKAGLNESLSSRS